MKITKKQKSSMLKIAAIAAIAFAAYVVFNNMRNVVTDKVTTRTTTKEMAKDAKGYSKRQR